MSTIDRWFPLDAEYPSSNYPQLLLVNQRPVLAFDAATRETCYFTGLAPQGMTGTLTAYISVIMASATANLVDFDIAVEAITSGDAVDLDATTSFDTANTQAGVTVPGTAGYLKTWSLTLTNADSIAEGDYYRLAVARDAADGTNDTATGDAYLVALELRDAA